MIGLEKSPRLKMRLENHNIYNAATKPAFKGGFRLKVQRLENDECDICSIA